MATIEILGVPHAYELTAPTTAPQALVFIHGWLLSRGYWQPLIERLATDYQCLAYDLRGFGESQNSGLAPIPIKGDLDRCPDTLGAAPGRLEDLPKARIAASRQTSELAKIDSNSSQQHPLSLTFKAAGEWQEEQLSQKANASCYTPSAYAEDLVVLLQQLNISSAWLIGHSLGGSIALWGAQQLPECVKGVICINAGGGIYLKEAFEKFRDAGQQLLKVRPRWLRHLPLIDLLFTRANVARPLARYWGRQRLIDFVVAHPEAALGTLLDSTAEQEINRLPKVVSQLKQPVYFITGAKDQVMEPKYVRHLASFHSLFQACGDNVIEIPQCGHLAMVEQPEAVATVIRTILAQHE